MGLKNYLTGLILLANLCAYSQSTREYTDLMSDKTKSFTGTTDAASGRYSYSIPVVEFKDNKNLFLLNLNYSSSSIRFRDEAGVAGLGWSLNLPVIRREIRGLPDEVGRRRTYMSFETGAVTHHADFFIEENGKLKDDWHRYGLLSCLDLATGRDNAYLSTPTKRKHTFINTPDLKDKTTFTYDQVVEAAGKPYYGGRTGIDKPNVNTEMILRDYEPDVYHFSIPGFSGYFYYDEIKSDYVTVPKSNIGIIAHADLLKYHNTWFWDYMGWTIIAENGDNYSFNNPNISISYPVAFRYVYNNGIRKAVLKDELVPGERNLKKTFVPTEWGISSISYSETIDMVHFEYGDFEKIYDTTLSFAKITPVSKLFSAFLSGVDAGSTRHVL